VKFHRHEEGGDYGHLEFFRGFQCLVRLTVSQADVSIKNRNGCADRVPAQDEGVRDVEAPVDHQLPIRRVHLRSEVVTAPYRILFAHSHGVDPFQHALAIIDFGERCHVGVPHSDDAAGLSVQCL
jgi:hypothetical protein